MWRQRHAALSIFALFAIAIFAEVTNAGPPSRIVGGDRAVLGEFPYIVSLQNDGVHFCGGAIISSRFVLTAAHCVLRNIVYPYTEATVVAGTTTSSEGGKTYNVSDAIAHEGFDYWASVSENDIALIKLSSDIEFDAYTSAIELPKIATPGDVAAVIAGWGHTSEDSGLLSPFLNKATMKTVEPVQCEKLLIGSEISKQQICALNAKGIGTCHGDSGGPLVAAGNQVIGVSSYNLPCARGQPDVYTAVYYYLDWIAENMI